MRVERADGPDHGEASVVLEASAGEPLRDILERHGVSVPTACGGNAQCGMCRVAVVSGRDRLTPMREAEAWQLEAWADPTLRLACQARVCGDDVGPDAAIVVRVCDADTDPP